MDNIWEIKLWDGGIIPVKPENVGYVQSTLKRGDGFIQTSTMSINIKDIKEFSESDKVIQNQRLLEDGARAFKEPIYVSMGKVRYDTSHKAEKPHIVEIEYTGIKGAWVKKSISRKSWDSYYSKISGYRLLDENDTHVIIAFVLSTVDIDYDRVQSVTPDESLRLARLVH